MERLWTFDRLAVTMRRVDFLDPALAGQPGRTGARRAR